VDNGANYKFLFSVILRAQNEGYKFILDLFIVNMGLFLFSKVNSAGLDATDFDF